MLLQREALRTNAAFPDLERLPIAFQILYKMQPGSRVIFVDKPGCRGSFGNRMRIYNHILVRRANALLENLKRLYLTKISIKNI